MPWDAHLVALGRWGERRHSRYPHILPPPPSLLVMRIVGHTWVGDYKRTLMSSARGVTLEKSFPTIDELVPADDDAELVKAIGPAKEK